MNHVDTGHVIDDRHVDTRADGDWADAVVQDPAAAYLALVPG